MRFDGNCMRMYPCRKITVRVTEDFLVAIETYDEENACRQIEISSLQPKVFLKCSKAGL